MHKNGKPSKIHSLKKNYTSISFSLTEYTNPPVALPNPVPVIPNPPLLDEELPPDMEEELPKFAAFGSKVPEPAIMVME